MSEKVNEQQFEEMAQEALDHWDMELCEEGVENALNHFVANPDLVTVFNENYRQMHSDPFQALEEMAMVYAQLLDLS